MDDNTVDEDFDRRGGDALMGGLLPVRLSPYGPFAALALHVHDLTIRGLHQETLVAADEAERVAGLLGDERTVRMIRLARVYALSGLGRLGEALAIGEHLAAQRGAVTGPRSTDAKIIADTAEILIRLGRMDDGLHQLARSILLLEVAPRADARYVSAASSLCEAARAAELFEFADVCVRVALETFGPDDTYRSYSEVQRAELLLEWALRLEQIGRIEEATRLYADSVSLLRPWMQAPVETPLVAALLAVALAKTDGQEEALALGGLLLVDLRAAGQQHEARLLHLACGLGLRATGDLRAARRELLAADELADMPTQRLIIGYELASLAAQEDPGEATRTMLGTVRSQIELLWRLRLDRRAMLRQAYKRVELERARMLADLVALSDPLTSLGNRRMFDQKMQRVPVDTVLLLIDVDRFKDINDGYSHSVGDRVLAQIAMVLRAQCRHDEVAIRFGGDEFALFLHNDMKSAARVAERIRQTIKEFDWSAIADGLNVTLSMGMATFLEGMTGPELYDSADTCLYTAKRQGRDRVAA